MRDLYDIIENRRSIRKYKDQDIPQEDIEEIVQTAAKAPSACNEQMWKFVVVKNKEVINKIAGAIYERLDEMKEWEEASGILDRLDNKKRAVTFFAEAPVVVAVYMNDFRYYDPDFRAVFKERFSSEEQHILFGDGDIQSIGAAIQNLLLAVEEKGYGACWMCEPIVAYERINKVLGEENGRLMAIIPIGVPAQNPKMRPKKSFNEICEIIE